MAADNDTTLGVNIGEGCAPSVINNAIRKVMADFAGGVNMGVLGTFLASTTLAQARSALEVTGGSTSLTNLAALTNTANKVPYMTGSDGWALTDLFPSGAVLTMATTSVPSGWLECDGAAVSRSTYSTLFGLIATTYGVGDGSTTFNVPDLRGEFVRGYDHGRGVDAARAIGSSQIEALKSHTHDITATQFDGLNGAQNYMVTDLASSNYTVATAATGGTETRPRNVALMYIIKT